MQAALPWGPPLTRVAVVRSWEERETVTLMTTVPTSALSMKNQELKSDWPCSTSRSRFSLATTHCRASPTPPSPALVSSSLRREAGAGGMTALTARLSTSLGPNCAVSRRRC